MTPGPLLALGTLALVLAIALGSRLPRTWLALTLVGTSAALAAAWQVLFGSADWDWRSGFRVGGESLHLRLDGVSAWFVLLLSAVGAAGAIYSREYWSDHHYPGSAPRGRQWWSGLVLSLIIVLTSSNGLHFLIGWEVFTVCAYFLITLNRERAETRAAGWLYLVASHTGTVCLFAFFCTLAAKTGSWELGPMRENTELTPLFWLVLFGFGIKAGVFPLHVWLPAAHANAPSHVSAILSGVAIKMGIYGIVRFSGWLPVPAAAGWVVIGIGAISAVVGIAFALVQNDLKRLLAYCSVENIGIILIGVGGALLATSHGDAAWGRLALAGALLHVWNHGAFKSLLFFCAGSVLHATGTREMSRLGGLWRLMPWTAGLFAVGAAAVSGLPPFNGFVSEWLVYLGLIDAVTGRGSSAWAALPAAIALALAGALALASFIKASSMVFLGASRTTSASGARESGAWIRGPMVALAGVCLAIGLAPTLIWPALGRAVGTWHAAWSGSEAPAPLLSLGSAHLGLAILGSLAVAALWRKARANGLRRALTWDCGYAAPTARMQYTGGSFSAIAAGWFFGLLQPERSLRRPRGPFPAGASWIERIPDTVLERVIGPMGDGVMRVSTAVRRLQHGRLQSYLLYLLVGLVALGMVVFFGGKP